MCHTLWRQYDSRSGRWSAPDPYGGSMNINSPQSFNRYAYVNNDPVNKVDVTGLMLSDIGVYQTNNPEEAQIAEHQSLRSLQSSVNADHFSKQIQGGSKEQRAAIGQAIERLREQSCSANKAFGLYDSENGPN